MRFKAPNRKIKRVLVTSDSRLAMVQYCTVPQRTVLYLVFYAHMRVWTWRNPIYNPCSFTVCKES